MTGPTRSPARCRSLLLELSRYLDGDLTPARRRTIERHIEECTCCGTMAACLRKTLAACRAAGEKRLPRTVRSRAAARIRALLKHTNVERRDVKATREPPRGLVERR